MQKASVVNSISFLLLKKGSSQHTNNFSSKFVKNLNGRAK